MTIYNVTLLVAGIGEEQLDGIFEATDGVATVEMGDRWTGTDRIDIEADTFADAVLQVIDQIEQVPGLAVVRVDPDQLVWASRVADRVGRTRQSIDQSGQGPARSRRVPRPRVGERPEPTVALGRRRGVVCRLRAP